MVELTSNPNAELKSTATTALKNMLFKSQKEVKAAVMRELTYEKLQSLLNDEAVRVREQALLIYRNLLSGGEDDIQIVLNESGQALLDKFLLNLN